MSIMNFLYSIPNFQFKFFPLKLYWKEHCGYMLKIDKKFLNVCVILKNFLVKFRFKYYYRKQLLILLLEIMNSEKEFYFYIQLLYIEVILEMYQQIYKILK